MWVSCCTSENLITRLKVKRTCCKTLCHVGVLSLCVCISVSKFVQSELNNMCGCRQKRTRSTKFRIQTYSANKRDWKDVGKLRVCRYDTRRKRRLTETQQYSADTDNKLSHWVNWVKILTSARAAAHQAKILTESKLSFNQNSHLSTRHETSSQNYQWIKILTSARVTPHWVNILVMSLYSESGCRVQFEYMCGIPAAQWHYSCRLGARGWDVW